MIGEQRMTPLVQRFIMHKRGVVLLQADWDRMPYKDAFLFGQMLQESEE